MRARQTPSIEFVQALVWAVLNAAQQNPPTSNGMNKSRPAQAGGALAQVTHRMRRVLRNVAHHGSHPNLNDPESRLREANVPRLHAVYGE